MDLKDDVIVFDPSSPKYRWKLWVRVATPGARHYHVYWKRMAGTAAVLLVIFWLAAAGGVWGFLRYRRDYLAVRYIDIAFYPWRAKEFRTGLARHYLAMGHEAVQKQKYHEGYALLAAGLRRLPEDMPARREVAIMQVQFGFVHRALETLADGLPYHPDLDYLKLMFGWLLEAKEDERAIALAEKFLPSKPDSDLKHLFVALQAAIAHFERGRYDEAERFVLEWGLVNSLEGQILLARIEAERGAPELAVRRLEAEIGRFGKRDELYLELVRQHRAMGHSDEARRYALLRRFNDPRSPGPRIDVLFAYHQSDDKPAETREVETYLTDFATESRALDELAWFAAATHQPALIQRVRVLAQGQQFPLSAIMLAQAQEAFNREAYGEVLPIVEAGAKIVEKDSYAEQLLGGMKAVALFGTGDKEGGHRAAVALSNGARLRASDALLFARQFRLLGKTAEARLLLERACVLDPLNESALAELVRMEAEQGERSALAANLPRLLKMRKPPRPVLEELLLRLQKPEDAELAKQVREALAR